MNGETLHAVSPLMLIPFAFLLGAIATAPQLVPRWWARNYSYVSFILGGGMVLVYLKMGQMMRMEESLLDYFSFILLIGSLYVVSGGILIHWRRPATPLTNVLFLFTGAFLSNFFGTTGASALLIRPYLRMNRGRVASYQVVFFIFLVSNIGGLLTPVGDPPLFLGYLKGVPFFWMVRVGWPIWLCAIFLLLMLFYLIDRRHFTPRTESEIRERPSEGSRLSIDGWIHFLFLSVILSAVFLKSPLRELLMAAAALGSYLIARPEIYRENEFDLHPMYEVAVLFFGIFITMVPALDWLHDHASQMGVQSVSGFFWGSGILSSVLDNAPTYLNFLSAAFGINHLDLQNPSHLAQFLSKHQGYLAAVSVGSVFFGANTYIGNGPNLLVKGISEAAGVKLPSFWGYVFRYSIPILIPVYLLIWGLFFMQA